jgi:hypothetical protein
MKYLLLILQLLLFCSSVFAQELIPGYSKPIKGDDFQYHSPQPDAGVSMLIRSEDARDYIEWETAPLPYKFYDERANFLMLAGIDVNGEDPQSWAVYVNGHKYFTISSPTSNEKKELKWMGHNNSILEFRTTELDKYGDLMGYLTLSLNPKQLEEGKPITIKVKPVESAGSQTWFMVFKYTTRNHVKVSAENAIMKNPEGETQVLKTEAVYYGPSATAVFTVGKEFFDKQLNFGYNVHYLEIPKIKKKTNIPVKVLIGEDVLVDEKVTLEPVREMTIFLVHHTHVDIGYTHVQEEVEKLQWAHLEKAIELAEASQDNPYGSRFKWNTEVMWAVESYLKQANKKQRAKFMEAIKRGWIELDGMYANMLTGLCSPEELFHLFDAGVNISAEAGKPLRSAMITDIPGWSWGIVAPMAQSGIRYFSAGTNRSHRIGNIIKTWGDKPFYWVSPSGEEKVLTWIHQEGYSLFHTGLGSEVQKNLLSEEKIFPYLSWMAENNYPYNMTVLRYNIGSDNGPPDENLPKLVKAWNDKYASPQLVISTISEAFGIIEKRFGETIPEYRGDLTGYWEDGAISSAIETSLNRNNASRLNQLETIISMNPKVDYPQQSINGIWKNIMLYDEHTWGSWNSISEPESPFTLRQWETKRAFAIEASKSIDALSVDAMKSRESRGKEILALEVTNTNSWPSSGWATFTFDEAPNTSYIAIDASGNKVPTNSIGKYEMSFYVESIPAFSSRIYSLQAGGSLAKHTNMKEPYSIENNFFNLLINNKNGSIEKLIWKKTGEDLVDNISGKGLNQYLYVAGRSPESPESAIMKKITQVNESTLLIEMEASGCIMLVTQISIDDQAPRVEITNTLHKSKVYDPEGVHFAFPFAIKNGEMHYDLAMADCQPEKEQLPASNKNFITIENYLDISNKDFGITWVSPDAPLIEVGEIMNDPTSFGYVDHLEPSQTFYSYVMNNYWETNYLAAQEGVFTARYTIEVNDSYNPAQAEKLALEQRQPFIVIQTSIDQEIKKLGINIDNPNIIVFACRKHEGDLLLSLQNYSDQPQTLNYKNFPSKLAAADFWGREKEPIRGNIVFPAWGIRHVKLGGME